VDVYLREDGGYFQHLLCICSVKFFLKKQGWKSCPQVTNLNLNHCKMVEDMGLKLLHRGPLEWHHLPTKYHESLPSGSKVVNEGRARTRTHTHTHTTHRLVIWSIHPMALQPKSGLGLLYWSSVTIMFYGVRLLASRPIPVNFGGPVIFCWGLLP
jgi:hypothetical protein